MDDEMWELFKEIKSPAVVPEIPIEALPEETGLVPLKYTNSIIFEDSYILH